MSQTQVRSEGPRRRHWLQILVASIIALIVALVFTFWLIRPLVNDSLPRADSIVRLITATASRMAAMAGVLAVVATVLALARHVLRGGYPQPAEWLALALVLSWPEGASSTLYNAFLNGLHALTLHPIEIGEIVYAPKVTTISLFLTLVGCLAFAAARPVIPSRARTPIVFILALLVVWGAIPAIPVEFLPMIESISVSGLGLPQQAVSTSCLALTRMGFAFTVALPVIATIRDYRRRDRPDWSPSEWLGAVAGLLMGLSWLIGILTLVVALSLKSSLRLAIGAGTLDLVDLGARVAAFGLAWIVVRHYSAAWNHWLNAKPDRAAPPRTASEG